MDPFYNKGIGVIDLETRTLTTTFPNVAQDLQRLILSSDGATLYALGLAGDVVKLNAQTGEVLGSKAASGINYHSMVFSSGETEILAGGQPGVTVFDADTLEILRTFTLSGVSDVGDLRHDKDPAKLYFADSSGARLGAINPATGEIVKAVAVGNRMKEVVGSDALNRTYGNVQDWDMVMAANLGTGVRSDSYRETPSAPTSLAQNQVTGDLLTANAGWHSEKGSTVSIFNAPGVTDPVDVTASTVGETVSFTTVATGIKPNRGGGVQWQSSPDGTTWTDIAGATGDHIELTVDPSSISLSYRVRWSDDFWGMSGVSAAASIKVPSPKITLEGTLPSGVVGAIYPDTTIMAIGQDDLRWSADPVRAIAGVPAGLELDPETGVLSGTPEVAGEYLLTVTVTDVFGMDTKDFPLVVTDEVIAPPTTPPPTPPTTAPGIVLPGDDTEPVDGLAVTGASPRPLVLGAGALILIGAIISVIRRRFAI